MSGFYQWNQTYDDEVDYSDLIDECEIDEEFEEFMCSMKSLKSWE